MLRLLIDIKPSHAGFVEIPYDFFGHSVKETLKGRVCAICGLYFVTKKGDKFHKEQVHGKTATVASKNDHSK